MIDLRDDIKKLIGSTEFYKESFKVSKPSFFPIYSAMGSICLEDTKKILGKKTSVFIMYHKGDDFFILNPRKELDEFAQHLMKKFEDKSSFDKIIKEIELVNEKFKLLISHCQSLDTKKIAVGELFALYKKYIDELTRFRVYAWIPNIFSMSEYAAQKVYRTMLSKTVSNEEFSLLTNFPAITKSTASEKALLELIFKKKIDDASLNRWIEEWGYVYYYYSGPLPTLADARTMIAALDKGAGSVKARLNEISGFPKRVLSEKKKLIKKLNLTKKDVHIMNVLSYFNYYKAERKELMQKSYVAMDNIFFRLKELSGFEVDDIKLLTIDETKKLLGARDKSSFKDLITRRRYALMHISTNSKNILIDDIDQLDEISNQIRSYKPSKKLVAAFVGLVVKGKLIIVNSKNDLEKIRTIKEPFILASNSTYPDLLPAMTKGVGIVTRMGGMTSHAAIVSRELRKPCIVGYSDLFEEFKEGDMVELDTKEGKLTKV